MQPIAYIFDSTRLEDGKSNISTKYSSTENWESWEQYNKHYWEVPGEIGNNEENTALIEGNYKWLIYEMSLKQSRKEVCW